MVDKYTAYDKMARDSRLSKMKQQAFDGSLLYTFSTTLQHTHRRIMMIGESLEVCKEIKPASLDFVFIDADHCYESCSADIKAWYPKVRKGGVVSGHDYSGRHQGVCRAVDEFCEEHKYRLRRLTQCIWWVKND